MVTFRNNGDLDPPEDGYEMPAPPDGFNSSSAAAVTAETIKGPILNDVHTFRGESNLK